MRTVPLLAVIFFGSFFAQPALSESIISRDVSRSALNRADCEATNTVGVSWSIATSTASLSYTIRLEARDHGSASNPCPIGMGSSNVETLETLDVTNLNTQVDVTFNIDTNDIFEDNACDETGARETKTFCLYVRDQTNIDVASDGFTIAYDTVLPTELEVKSIQPGDEKIQFQVSGGDPNGDKILSYVVSYRSCDSEASSNLTASDAGVISADGGTPPDDAGLLAPGPHADAGPQVTDAGTTDPTPAEDDAGAAATDPQNDGGIAESFPMTDGRDGGSTSESLCDAKGDFLTMTSSTSTVTINDLNNDEQYEFKVYAIDDFDNAGPTSELFTAVPLNEVSVMNMYDGNPNPWGFNCQQAGSAPSWILLLLFSLFFLKRTRGPRRRVPFNGSALVVLLALTAQPARAEVGQTSFSMTGGPYKPAIDAEEVDGKPIFPIYDCFFDDETLTLLQLDFGYRAADGYGNLQLGLGLGYAQARGTAQTADILTTGRCGEQSSARSPFTSWSYVPTSVTTSTPCFCTGASRWCPT